MSRRRRAARRGVAPRELLGPVVQVVEESVAPVEVAPVAPWPDLSTMTVAQLRSRATELGVTLGKARTKAAIIEALGG